MSETPVEKSRQELMDRTYLLTLLLKMGISLHEGYRGMISESESEKRTNEAHDEIVEIFDALFARVVAAERELAELQERNNRLMENFAYWDSDMEYTCIHCGKFDSNRSGIVHDPDCPMLPEPPEAENE